MYQRFTGFTVLTIALLSFGCAKKDPFNRQEVSGTVTLKGKPVETGSIYFEPQEGQGVATNASISKGTFRLPKDSNGLSPGKYKWDLVVMDGPGPGGGEGGGADTGVIPKNLILPSQTGKVFEVIVGLETKLTIDIP